MIRLEQAGDGWRDDVFPDVRIRFAPVTRRAWRAAQRAAGVLLKGVDRDDGDAIEEAGDEISRILIERGIIDWSGVAGTDDQPIAPGHLFPVVDEGGDQVVDAEGQPVFETAVQRLIADPRRFARLDALYVMPFILKDMEGNASAGAPNGISAGATPAPDIATSPAASPTPARAVRPTRKRAKAGARTSKPSSRARKPKASGTS